MKTKQITITLEQLRKIIREEAGKFGKMKETEKVKADEKDADEQAELEKPINWMEKLDIKEAQLKKQLIEVYRQRRKLQKEETAKKAKQSSK